MKGSFKTVTSGDMGSWKNRMVTFTLEVGDVMKCQEVDNTILAKGFIKAIF
jgi:hypothetical protein